MSFHSRTQDTKDDWMTPKSIVLPLGEFDLDPCASVTDPGRLASRGFTVHDNGLSRDWLGRVWLNPPYGRDCRTWVTKLADHGNGIALIVPRTGSRWFRECVFDRADAVLFLTGRISFLNATTKLPVKGNNADSCLVAFGDQNLSSLLQSRLDGKLCQLKFNN